MSGKLKVFPIENAEWIRNKWKLIMKQNPVKRCGKKTKLTTE